MHQVALGNSGEVTRDNGWEVSPRTFCCISMYSFQSPLAAAIRTGFGRVPGVKGAPWVWQTRLPFEGSPLHLNPARPPLLSINQLQSAGKELLRHAMPGCQVNGQCVCPELCAYVCLPGNPPSPLASRLRLHPAFYLVLGACQSFPGNQVKIPSWQVS